MIDDARPRHLRSGDRLPGLRPPLRAHLVRLARGAPPVRDVPDGRLLLPPLAPTLADLAAASAPEAGPPAGDDAAKAELIDKLGWLACLWQVRAASGGDDPGPGPRAGEVAAARDARDGLERHGWTREVAAAAVRAADVARAALTAGRDGPARPPSTPSRPPPPRSRAGKP